MLYACSKWPSLRMTAWVVHLYGMCLTSLMPCPRCSCDGGNLTLMLVRRSAELLPYVALFASQDILPAQELTFCYGSGPDGQQQEESAQPPGQQGQQAQQAQQAPGQQRPGMRVSRVRCLCGTAQCTGWMPSEDV